MEEIEQMRKQNADLLQRQQVRAATLEEAAALAEGMNSHGEFIAGEIRKLNADTRPAANAARLQACPLCDKGHLLRMHFCNHCGVEIGTSSDATHNATAIPEDRAPAADAACLSCAAKQAKIDALMLEYCPNEMTPEQVAEWGRNQRRVGDTPTATSAAGLEGGAA